MEFLLSCFVHKGEPQTIGIEICKAHVNCDAISFMRHLYCNTFHLWLRKRLRDLFSVCSNEGHFRLRPSFRDDGEHTSTSIDGFHLLASYYQCPFYFFSVCHRSFKGYTILYARYQVPAFGEERELEFALVRIIFELAPHHTQGHIASVVTRCERFVVDGKHTAVEFIIIAEVFPFHLFVPKHKAKAAGMLMLMFSPIQLPSRIGSKFIKAAVLYLVVQSEEATASSLFHLNQFALHQIAVIVQQFYIKYAANFRRLACICLLCICSKPDCVALKVAGVVHMDINLFLRDGLTKGSLP